MMNNTKTSQRNYYKVGLVILIFFVISFAILIVVIFYFVLTAFGGPLNAFMGVILYVLGMMCFFGFLSMVTMKAKNRWLGILTGSLFLAVISTMGYYYMEKYSLIPFMLFFSSLATGSVIGLLITPIAYFYEKIKRRIK